MALPPEHRLAKRKSIRLTELADEPMVLLDLPDSRDYFESILAKAGVTPRIRYRSASYEAVRGLVARGHGFDPQPDAGAPGDLRRRRRSVVAIRDDLPGLPIVLARLQSVRSTARACRRHGRARYLR